MKKIIIGISIILLFFLYGCPDQTKVDPCSGATRVKASFTISESLEGDISGFSILSDTVLEGNIIHFKADDSSDTYYWKVGSDTTIYHSREFTLRFYQAYGAVPVTLIITKKPNTNCFPDDKGIDTLIKNIYVISFTNAAIIGNYYGCNQDNPKDSFVVNIGYNWDNNALYFAYFMNNLDKGCRGDTNLNLSIWAPTVEALRFYKGISFDMGDVCDKGCNNVKGNAIVENNLNNIKISYNEFQTPIDYKTRVSKVFIGRRVQ